MAPAHKTLGSQNIEKLEHLENLQRQKGFKNMALALGLSPVLHLALAWALALPMARAKAMRKKIHWNSNCVSTF